MTPYGLTISATFVVDGDNAELMRRARAVQEQLNDADFQPCEDTHMADIIEALETLVSIKRRARVCKGDR